MTTGYWDSREFEDRYTYTGRLGSFCGDSGTQFLLWAPTAEWVVLRIYRDCLCEKESELFILTRRDRGVWGFETAENLDGMYYNYEVTVDGVPRLTADPYARACGVNGDRSMVIDLRRTDPEGWELDRAPERPRENIVYELHVKDFTWDASSGISPHLRGKYLGLCQEGTTWNHDGIHPTGLDYIRKLGVTHVQLLPVFDYGSVDEKQSTEAFNWGYDPLNYNVPEGSYSQDPYHGEIRIRELKQVIQTMHRHGLRVIMDVVYNHTYQLDSFLNRTVPGYYYRFEDNGMPSNGSGCGNDLASERSMCARYILDSVMYWAEEYHFDGFRFDLMGLMPAELMNRIRAAMDERFGAGEKMLYGEPWRAADTNAREGTILADKPHLYRLDPGVGAFCDATRDAVKGHLLDAEARGFVNGGSCSKELLLACLRGWNGVKGEYSVRTPAQTINYLSCHDDWTLWDRLINTMDPERAYNRCPQRILRANRLAAAILCSCQGNLFLLSGEEFARTKAGVKNSFSSPIRLNRIDWDRARKNEEMVRYYRGLFRWRQQVPCLCSKSGDADRCIVDVYDAADRCVVAAVKDEDPECRWKELLLIFNMGGHPCRIPLAEGSWRVLVTGDDSEWWTRECYVEGEMQLNGVSAAILGR